MTERAQVSKKEEGRKVFLPPLHSRGAKKFPAKRKGKQRRRRRRRRGAFDVAAAPVYPLPFPTRIYQRSKEAEAARTLQHLIKYAK